MHLCHRDEIERLVESDQIEIGPADGSSPSFLDEHRLGLHIARIHELVGPVDLRVPERAETRLVDPAVDALLPARSYLAVTLEHFRLSTGFAASIHTRSRYARIGFEALSSSNFVVPGFGCTNATPIVLELSVKQPTSGITAAGIYSFALIYRIDSPRVSPNDNRYDLRFPIVLPEEFAR